MGKTRKRSRGGASEHGYRAISGEYVVQPSSPAGWVFDVKVADSTYNIIAVVGFSARNGKGVVYYQNVDGKNNVRFMSDYAQRNGYDDEIRAEALKYALARGIPVPTGGKRKRRRRRTKRKH
jgi:hypothetical protein